MKRFFTLVLCVLSLLLLSGCKNTENFDDGKISIVVTAFPHYDFARQLTQNIENVEIKMLISPGNEVHTYEPSPSDILAVSRCDLFIYTGGESDTWVKDILKSSGNENMRVVSFMEVCDAGNFLFDDEHGHEHEYEHEYDEHLWTSPNFSGVICEQITRELCQIDKDNEEIYNDNLINYLEKLDELNAAFDEIMKNANRDFIVVGDRFPFYHLAEQYGIEYLAAYPGCSSSTEPSAAVIASLSQTVKNGDIPYVFTIEFSNKKIAKSITEGTDAQILTLHSCHTVSKEEFEKGITYFDLMLQNAENLRKALCE